MMRPLLSAYNPMAMRLWRNIIVTALGAYAILVAPGCSDPELEDGAVSALPFAETAERLAPVRAQLDAARDSVLANPSSARAHGEYGKLMHAYGDYAAAEAFYARARALATDYFDWAHLHAMVLRALDRDAEALAAFVRALDLRPADVDARVGLAETLANLGEKDRAADDFRLVLAEDPNNVRARFGLAEQLLAAGEVRPAIAELERIVESGVRFGTLHATLAAAHRAVGEDADAERQAVLAEQFSEVDAPVTDALYQEVRALRVDDQPLMESAAAYLSVGNLSKAAAAYEEAIELNPNNSQAHTGLIGIFADMGKVDLAQKHFELTIELDPAQPTAYTNVGIAYLHEERVEDARRAFEKAIELDPMNPTSRSYYAYTCEIDGREAEAEAAWMEALAIDESDPLANFLHGRRIALTEDCETALPYLARSVAGPDTSITPALLVGVANCYGQAGKFDEAFEAVSRGERLARQYRNEDVLAQFRVVFFNLSKMRAAERR